MTTEVAGFVPEVTLGWRLRMSLEGAGVSVQEIADEFGVDRNTISRWMHDKGAVPKRAYLSQWSLKTGVPLTWLETGVAADPQGPGGEDADVESVNILLGRQRLYQLSYVRDARRDQLDRAA